MIATFLITDIAEPLAVCPVDSLYGAVASEKIRYFRSMADKKRTEIDWQDVRIFLALARHGSLSAAARTLSVNHGTIARRLRSLEESVGEKLVERRADGYVLTPAGAQALEAASDMEQAAQIIGRGQMDEAPSGLVRINAPPALSSGFLTSRLATVVSRHSKIDIELAADHRSVSLERHEADIAIRFGKPEDGDVLARPLVTVGYGFYGTEDACRSVQAGADPVFVGFDEADAYLPEATWMARHFPRGRLAFRVANQFAQSVAARSGAGLALLPHYIGRSDPLLRICDLGPVPASKDIFLLTRRRDRDDRTVRIVVDEIVAIFQQELYIFK